MIVYVVCGEAGEYEDYEDWIVAAYLDKEKAKKHAISAMEWHKEYLENEKNKGYYDEDIIEPEYNPFDKGRRLRDSTKYDYYKLEVIE